MHDKIWAAAFAEIVLRLSTDRGIRDTDTLAAKAAQGADAVLAIYIAALSTGKTLRT
jgi:hypothetical protein